MARCGREGEERLVTIDVESGGGHVRNALTLEEHGDTAEDIGDGREVKGSRKRRKKRTSTRPLFAGRVAPHPARMLKERQRAVHACRPAIAVCERTETEIQRVALRD
jgi:hypothetical protein